MPMPPAVEKFLSDVDKYLYRPSKVADILGNLETKTGVRRLYLVGGIAALHALYLIFGHFAELLCNFVGFFYPAYISISAIESASKDDDTQWLTYWVVFALLNVIEFFSATITYYFPFYWLLKCLFLVWLYLPQTLGAQQLYVRFVRPLHLKHSGRIDSAVKDAGDHVRSAYEHNVKPN